MGYGTKWIVVRWTERRCSGDVWLEIPLRAGTTAYRESTLSFVHDIQIKYILRPDRVGVRHTCPVSQKVMSI